LSLPGPAAQHGCRRAVVVRAQVVVAAAAVEQRRAADLAAEVQRVAAVLTVDGDVAHAVVVDVDLVVAVARVDDQRERGVRSLGAPGAMGVELLAAWPGGERGSVVDDLQADRVRRSLRSGANVVGFTGRAVNTALPLTTWMLDADAVAALTQMAPAAMTPASGPTGMRRMPTQRSDVGAACATCHHQFGPCSSA
jgi:hypothetical protein